MNKKSIVYSIIVVLAATVALIYTLKDKEVDRKAWDESAQGYLLQNASPSIVHEGYRPVLIYRYRGAGRPAYTAAGTWFLGKNGPIIATCEHLLQEKFAKELFVVRFLSPDEHKADTGIISIAYRNTEAGLPANEDVVFLRPGPGSAKPIPCNSEAEASIPKEMRVYLFDTLEVGGRKIRHLKSLITGKEYPIAGASQSPQRILIRYDSNEGQSGTGFVDEYGQLYVLSSSTKQGSITMLCGPYENLQKRL